MVRTENASARDELSPATLTLRWFSRAVEVLLPSPWNVVSDMQILGDKNYCDSLWTLGIAGGSWAGTDAKVSEGSEI